MIGFKVIDTENGDVENDVKYEYVVDQVGWLSKINSDDREIQVDSRYKAVPSITIDGVEYYHGMVVESIYLSGCIGVLKFGEYTEHFDSEQLSHIGWYVYCYDSTQGIYVRTSVRNEKGEVWFECLGNVWQREHKDRLPLMEE